MAYERVSHLVKDGFTILDSKGQDNMRVLKETLAKYQQARHELGSPLSKDAGAANLRRYEVARTSVDMLLEEIKGYARHSAQIVSDQADSQLSYVRKQVIDEATGKRLMNVKVMPRPSADAVKNSIDGARRYLMTSAQYIGQMANVMHDNPAFSENDAKFLYSVAEKLRDGEKALGEQINKHNDSVDMVEIKKIDKDWSKELNRHLKAIKKGRF
ncbi:MAG: hypothetical protein V1836_03560 [Candidatus Aenigmatarchaeota archaeon]